MHDCLKALTIRGRFDKVIASLSRAPDAAQRAALAAWCAADPGPVAPQKAWVPALRSSAKSAAPRPGHDAELHLPKSRLLQRRAAFFRRQRLQKRLHRRAIFPRRHQREIIMLFGERNKT